MKHGVTELAEYLPDALRFGNIDPRCQKIALENAKNVTTALESMREALAAWNPREANRQSEALENALSQCELTFKNFS